MKKVKRWHLPKDIKLSHDIYTGHKPTIYYVFEGGYHKYYCEDVYAEDSRQLVALYHVIKLWNKFNLERRNNEFS